MKEEATNKKKKIEKKAAPKTKISNVKKNSEAKLISAVKAVKPKKVASKKVKKEETIKISKPSTAKTAKISSSVKKITSKKDVVSKVLLNKLKIKLFKSLAGINKKRVACAKSLGLKKIGDEVIQPNNPQTLGKIAKVSNLVLVKTI